MAINLLTGLPGNGKTLFTLSFVKEWAERENRPVFYHGIPELSLNWTKLDDPEKWYDCPPNSIIVIDECQEIFRPRAASKEPPMHVSQLETHRHKGIDLWLMTQHPSLADVALRRLTQTHRHIVRIWGLQAATVHQWNGAQLDCEKDSARSKSIKNKWKFDKKAYGYYKSAEVHTVKAAIPARVFMLAALPLILIGLGYVAYLKLKPKEIVPVSPVATAATLSASASANANKPAIFDPIADAMAYAQSHTPRLPGLPQTEPRYDELTKPTSVPVPAACVSSGDRCSCYSQQATAMNVPKLVCLEIVARGFYQDFNPSGKEPDLKANQPVFQGEKIAVSDRSAGSPVVSLTQEGYGVLGATGRGKPQSAL